MQWLRTVARPPTQPCPYAQRFYFILFALRNQAKIAFFPSFQIIVHPQPFIDHLRVIDGIGQLHIIAATAHDLLDPFQPVPQAVAMNMQGCGCLCDIEAIQEICDERIRILAPMPAIMCAKLAILLA